MDLRKSPPFPTITRQQADPRDKNRTFSSNLSNIQRSRENPKRARLGFKQNPDEKTFDLRVSENLEGEGIEVELLSKQEM